MFKVKPPTALPEVGELWIHKHTNSPFTITGVRENVNTGRRPCTMIEFEFEGRTSRSELRRSEMVLSDFRSMCWKSKPRPELGTIWRRKRNNELYEVIQNDWGPMWVHRLNLGTGRSGSTLMADWYNQFEKEEACPK